MTFDPTVLATAAVGVVKMYCRQTSGGDLTMDANAYAPRLSATWLRQAT